MLKKLFAPIFLLLTVELAIVSAQPVQDICYDETSCDRYRSFKDDSAQMGSQNDIVYHIDATSVNIDNELAKISGLLNLGCQPAGFLASSLAFEFQFYENGIMRTYIEESATPNARFRISQEDLPVMWDQLTPITSFENKVSVSNESIQIVGIERTGTQETLSYTISFSPLTIT